MTYENFLKYYAHVSVVVKK